jgi:hypothetical protein
LGGTISVTPVRDRIDGVDFFTVCHISRCGGVVFRSGRIPDEDRAIEAAKVLAEFTGSVLRR